MGARNGLSTLVLLLACMCSRGQQSDAVIAQSEPLFTQYMFNQLYFNPAAAGKEDGVQFRGVYRNQWVGLNRNPVAGIFSVDLPSPRLRGGVGIVASLNRLGFEKNSLVKVAYAYQRHFDQGGTLSIGTDVGLVNTSSDFQNGIIIDPNNPGNTSSQSKVDLGVGVMYRTERFYAGASAMHLTEPTYDFGTKLPRHLFLTSGFRVPLVPGIMLQPSILFRTDSENSDFDLNVNAEITEVLLVGTTFRQDEALAFILGYKLGDYFQVSYSYDITTTETRQNTDGSHELVLNYVIRKK